MIVPRPAQALAIPAARKALEDTGRALVVLATALGKMLASALIWHGFRRGRGLFLVHDNGILDHAMQEYRKVYGRRARLVRFEGRPEAVRRADIVFSTFQMMGNHLHELPADTFDWMTVDEGHHSQATTYRTTIEHFTCPRLSITATPNRSDELDIRELFGEEVINISLEEAIARGWLPPIEYHVVTDEGFDEEALKRITEEVLKEGHRLSFDEINRRVFIRARDEKIAEIIEQYKEKTVIFCRNIDHVEHFVGFLQSAETYHSDHSRDYNRDVLSRLRAGDTRRVLAVNAFNEGIDVPDVGLIVFYRTTESETIFRQQLGRGMRPGKEKLIVLDFVGNLQRIQMLMAMVDKVKKLREELGPDVERGSGIGGDGRLHVSGTGFDFVFSDAVVDLMSVLDRVQAEFYPTWQEAGQAALRIGIKTSYLYGDNYRKDAKLPSDPNRVYADFPGWEAFFGRTKKDFYPKWEEAGAAAVRLNIATAKAYHQLYRGDARLPAAPHKTYADFPGWTTFLSGRELRFYSTVEEASRAAQALGISDARDYLKKSRSDNKLPSNPNQVYADFPGWPAFLGRRRTRRPR
ncbi:MAG: DEAD/DEAH box helicase family protein [Patescibacteria group bacterium]|nr:DEAD/DEAH box helicase [Patescibacteria group bacterium]MDE2057392.1 DEAD/DEAH box helicase family protein [Patescibacteria group bacterium]